MENRKRRMRRRRGFLSMGLGILCFAAALLLIERNNREEEHGAWEAESVAEVLSREVLPEISLVDGSRELAETCMQTVEIDGHEYIGVLELPELGLSLPIMNEWDDELLKLAPCRYKGSFLENSMIIAGHNYKRHFSGIKQMKEGDSVFFTDVNGNCFSYEVDSIEIIDGTDLDGMEDGDWDLTLFTCNYGGQKRVTLRCRLSSSAVSSPYNSLY